MIVFRFYTAYIGIADWNTMELKVGVVGSCPPTPIDEVEAQQLVRQAYDTVVARYPDHVITIVSGLTNVGVLGIAYAEAARRRWRTVGITSGKALNEYPLSLYPVDECRIIGQNWGDESEAFLAECDVLIRIGGGPQSHREVDFFRQAGGDVIEYELEALPPL